MMVLVLVGCVRWAPLVPPVEFGGERDPSVIVEAPEVVLLAGLAAPDGAVQALAVESLLRDPLPCGPEAGLCGLAPALALMHRDDDRVRLAVVAGLRAHPGSAEAGEHLWALASGAVTADPRIRGFAAMALAERPDSVTHDRVVRLAAEAPASGASLGLLAAGAMAGAPGAHAKLEAVFLLSTLPIEPGILRAIDDAALPWRAAFRRVEPVARPALLCAMLQNAVPGALSTATRLLHDTDEGLRDDTASSLATCRVPAAGTALRRSSIPAARLARVARSELPPGAARADLDTDRWPDAVRALAGRSDPEAHAVLHEFVSTGGDTEREEAAVALSRNPLPTDLPTLESLATDASLRTRVAAAAGLRRRSGTRGN
ncbi:MAG: hypothetical protein EXR71_09955 [Myxococcales bacterium]|nr:hypothetical protein [Myxococcales bacterium]